MAASTDFDYTTLLSLDRAKLVRKRRLNFLGTKELVLDYKNVTSGSKEECVEWLEENRLTLTDPSFGFRTYTGTWKCVSIDFVDNGETIRQTFKIDSTIIDDVAQRSSSGVEAYRSYYFKVTDPTAYNIPSSVEDGVYYSKRVQDNGDGTYDVVIERTTGVERSGDGAVQASTYTEESSVSINSSPISFVADGGSVANAVTGEIKRIDNIPLENGKYRTTITTRTSIPIRVPATEGTTLQWFSDWDVSQPNMYILGENRTLAQFYTDHAILPTTVVRSHSLSFNDDGTVNYIINGFV